MYLHVFTLHISIRTQRHKHPHYVLMWRRIHFPVNNIFVPVSRSQQTDQPTCRGQWNNFPSFCASSRVTLGGQSFLPAFLQAKLLALPSFLVICRATPNHRDDWMFLLRRRRRRRRWLWCFVVAGWFRQVM